MINLEAVIFFGWFISGFIFASIMAYLQAKDWGEFTIGDASRVILLTVLFGPLSLIFLLICILERGPL
jgi:hypothetical protein